MPVSNITKLLDGGNAAGHRVDRLKRHDFGHAWVILAQQGVQVVRVVVAEDLLLAVAVSYAYDHGVVVSGIREVHQARYHLAKGGEGGIVGHVAGREDEPRLLAMEAGQLFLQGNVVVAVAGYVPGSSSTNAMVLQGLPGKIKAIHTKSKRDCYNNAPKSNSANKPCKEISCPRLWLQGVPQFQ